MVSGKIFCFIVSEGLINDIIDGRQIIPYCQGMYLKHNKLVIEDRLLPVVHNAKTGGLRNLIQ